MLGKSSNALNISKELVLGSSSLLPGHHGKRARSAASTTFLRSR